MLFGISKMEWKLFLFITRLYEGLYESTFLVVNFFLCCTAIQPCEYFFLIIHSLICLNLLLFSIANDLFRKQVKVPVIALESDHTPLRRSHYYSSQHP